jgi:hypothetical protein
MQRCCSVQIYCGQVRVISVCEQLVYEVLKRKAALRENAHLSILRENDVDDGQRGYEANSDSFFIRGDYVKTDTPLTLGVEHGPVYYADDEHVSVPG